MKTTKLAALAFSTLINVASAEQVVFTEIMYNPAGNKPEYIEIKNISWTPRDICKWRFSDGVVFELPDFNVGAPQSAFIQPLERIIISSSDPATTRAAYNIPVQTRVFGPWTGSLSNSGERITLEDKNGMPVGTLNYKNGGRWPKTADGTGHSLMIRNENCDPADFRNWKASATVRGSASTTVTAISYTDVWKYLVPSADPGTSWTTVGFNDSAWGSGPGLFGYDNDYTPSNPSIGTPVGAPGDGRTTYLFRKTFTFSGNLAGASYAIDQIIDDGARYYLNGNLLNEIRLTNPGSTWNELASPSVTNAAEELAEATGLSGSATGLVNGTNVLAVEMHNNGAGGSDMIFGAKLRITSSLGGGSPSNAVVRLSEVHFNANGNVDWVELQNPTGTAQVVNDLFLSSESDLSDKVAISGGPIPANAYMSFVIPNGGFDTDSKGNLDLFLADGAGNIKSAAELTRVLGRDSLQAFWPIIPASKPTWELLREDAEWYSSTASTQNLANALPVIPAMVINEIMCNPMSEQDNAQFIELYNNSGGSVNLGGWKLRGEVEFDIPAGTTIPANGYLVIAANKAWLQTVYGSATIVGDWSGNLSKKGDLIRLLDQHGNLADEVDYKSGGDWPDLGANKGSSLELINPTMDNNRASAWRASDESNKAVFSTYSVSGTFQEIFDPTPVWTLEQFMNANEYKEWCFRLPKEAHIELRNITLQHNGSGSNLLQNVNTVSNTGSSSNGWLCQGTHAPTYMDGSSVLHLISDGHGDNKENRIEIDCTGINAGNSYTMTFEARWVSGTPRLVGEVCLQTIGKAWLIDVPNNLGTPGAINSRNNNNALPQVDSIIHSPAVPKSNQSVKVTARVVSSTGIGSVQVFHRQDDINNGNNYAAQAMFDDGTNGDAVSGDGVYTANITAHQANNRIVQFYVRATAGNGQQAYDPPDGGENPAMWMVDDRTINSDLRRQRFILSMYDRDALDTLNSPWGAPTAKYGYKYPRLQGHYFNMTFIHDEGEVYYNGGIRMGGSRWSRGVDGEFNRAKWKLPSDRVFRNREKSNYDNAWIPNRLELHLGYLIGYAPCEQEEYAYTLFNSDGVAVRNDKELTDSDLLNRAFPGNDDGILYEILEHYWTKDDYNDTFRKADWSYKGTDDLIRYHTNFPIRTREHLYDYGALIEMFKLVSNGSTSREQLDRVIDPDYAMQVAAMRGYTGDWDGWPLNGKNSCIYQHPKTGRLQVLHWDGDGAFQNPAVLANRAGWNSYQDKPWHRRKLNYYLHELISWTDSSANLARTNAWLVAQENSSSAWMVHAQGIQYYLDWFANRKQAIIDTINQNAGAGGAGNAYSASFTISSPANGSSTASSTVNFTGTAPSSAYSVVLDNHPEAIFEWTNQTTWTLNGVVLKTNSNALVFRMVDQRGAQVGSTLNWSVSKTGNAAPVLKLNVDPGSYNVTLGETLTLDASTSYDPDSGVLTFNWSSNPSGGVTLTTPVAIPANSVRKATFTTPGIYTFTLNAVDPLSGMTSLNREIAVANSEDFDSFGTASLSNRWTVANVENRDSYSPSRWYSLSDKPGQLLLQVLDSSAKPLGNSNTHPFLVWNMPSAGDCAILTDATLESRKTGTFFTGLCLETLESGVVTRYAFGLDSGTQISVRRLSGGGSYADVATPQSSDGDNAKLRIRRVGNQLRFERRNDANWSTLFNYNMAAGSTLVKGGVFLCTNSAENARVAFDYFMLVDPSNVSTSVYNSLRITELMYNPRGATEAEYIEVKNIGGSPIDLNGVKIDSGVTLNITSTFTLAAGQTAIFTNNSTAFHAQYAGFNPALVAQWTSGSLSNGGERIALRDVDNNTIHDFEYSDASPWPSYPDGHGGALEVVNTGGDYNDPANWRSTGAMPGGGTDSDGDGVPDAWEAKFGTSSSDPLSKPRATTSVNGSNQTQIQWQGVSGQNYRVEYCDTLGAGWQTLSGASSVSGVNGNVIYNDPQLPRPNKRFYRIMAL